MGRRGSSRSSLTNPEVAWDPTGHRQHVPHLGASTAPTVASVLTTASTVEAIKMANPNALWSAMEEEASISARHQECGRISAQVDQMEPD